jgi:GT2 family glycosyltransferase
VKPLSGEPARASVAVVIVNLNAGELLARTLDALARQTVRPRRVIIVDNASTDGSAEGLEERFPDVEVMRLPENAGFAVANNLAVRAAEDCEWVALLNPDAFPEPTWLETLLEATRTHPQYSFFGSRLLRADDPGELDGAGDVYHVSGLAWRRGHASPAAGAYGEPEEVFSPCAAAALYRRDAFLSVGGFDESFFCYHEDNDLAFRLRLRGERCLYVPDAVCQHVGSAIAGATSDFSLYHQYRNLVWTWAKNMPAPLLWLYLPQHLLLNASVLATFGLAGRARVIARAQRDALKGLPRVLRDRRRVQATRTVAARALRSAMATGIEAPATASARVNDRLLAPRPRPSSR